MILTLLCSAELLSLKGHLYFVVRTNQHNVTSLTSTQCLLLGAVKRCPNNILQWLTWGAAN